MKKKEFLALLEEEADKQAKLQKRKILPENLSGLWSFVAENTWQVVLILSGFLAVILTLAEEFTYV